MSDAPHLGSLELELLEVATGLSGVRSIPDIVVRLRRPLALAGGTAACGLCVHDDDRGLSVWHVLRAGSDAVETFETAATPPSDVRPLAAGERRAGALVLPTAPDDALARALGERGVTGLAGAPLRVDGQDLGALFVGAPRGASLESEHGTYLVQLARIVEPHVWGCVTRERFSRGDRRRDALRELSRVINTSLEPRAVLHLARSAIGAIEGHRASWLGLLDADGRTWRRFDRPAEYVGEDEPALERLAGSVMERLAASGRTLESGDLALGAAFPGDEALQSQGVRRWIATPLRAGGKVLGAFLFGTDDPRPALRIDVWLIENIAVQIALAIDNALHYEEIQRLSARREQQNVYLREEIRSEHDAQGMIGNSPAMRTVFERIARVADTESTVLISGPTGVGKELVARAIHDQSRRRDQPMVKLNCAAIPEGMVESELFGHERGAFTSAVDRRIGRFELANNGTLFLDEIGELPLAVQAKLLRVLQSGEFERVGGSKTLTSNARIVAATNRDLSKALASGAFRSDLYYRLEVFPIAVPPLDERREDVPLLAQAFLEQFARRMGKRFAGIEPDSLARLAARSWPGNVRELKHVIERAVILCDGERLAIPDEPARTAEPVPAPERARAGLATLEEVEDAHIRSALRRTGGVVEGPNGAAALLGMKSSTLRFRMKRRGIRRPGTD